MSTPLNVDRIERGSLRGFAVLDRWSVDPTLEDLVTEWGPDLGYPKYYNVLTNAAQLRGERIHHSRAWRFTGVEVPYQQKLTENLWSVSVLERLYDRIVAFDSSTTGAAQLTYKSYLRTYKVHGLRKIVAAGGVAYQNLQAAVALLAQYQSTEGISIIDSEDELEAMGQAGFSGIADALVQFGQQMCGALQIPAVRFFGQSPAGLNSTGESDLRTYYDNVRKEQNNRLFISVDKGYRLIARSEGIRLGDKFSFKFKSLWIFTRREQSEIVTATEGAVADAFDRGIIQQHTAMKELRQASRETGVFSSITDEEIAEAEAAAPSLEELQQQKEDANRMAAESGGEAPNPPAKPRDSAAYPGNLPIMLENLRGSMRRGGTLAADYGYIVGTEGADGDAIDVFVGPYTAAGDVFVIHQARKDGTFDEHKCCVGFADERTALDAYFSSHDERWGRDRVMKTERMSMPEFKLWLRGHARREAA